MKEIVVNATNYETRVAILEDERLVEIYIERAGNKSIVGNVYKGRVTRVLPGMEAAFVDIGLGKDAFLYVNDVYEDLAEYQKMLSPEDAGENEQDFAEMKNVVATLGIQDLLREGRHVLVRVTKEPIGTKGPRVTTHVTLPGRYMVLMPTVGQAGVSRKIKSRDERIRLKSLVRSMRRGPEGLIVRTAAEGLDAEHLEKELNYLHQLWDEIRMKADRLNPPALVHRELNLLERVVRDSLWSDVTAIHIDSEKAYEQCIEFISKIDPATVPKAKLYGHDYPIFEKFGVERELEKALQDKVWLKSGGYIVINHTEALVAIDVNTGKFVGKRSLEDTIAKTNLESVKEIIRQIRLRDLGGIIVIDFIDMENPENQAKLMEALETELKKDRSPSRIMPGSSSTLVILTRKRTRRSLEKILCQPCPYCGGGGMIKSISTICFDILNEVKKQALYLEGHEIILRVNPDVADALKDGEKEVLKEMQLFLNRPITIKADTNLHHEQFDLVGN
ncbi:MAG: Rne/Rng family ribonuclease [Acidobacteria bacterium]|nr:MAG: Rne/Rng family ribonuclease [Acidobacteriota bacterium]